MKTTELRAMDISALQKQLIESMQTQFTLRIKNLNKGKVAHQLQSVRKDIARIKTLLTEKGYSA